MIKYLRITGIALNAIGALILAWRVKGIIEAIITAQHANDHNFREMIKVMSGKEQDHPFAVGFNSHVEKKQEMGVKLLVVGFGCIALGNILIGASWYFEP